MDERLKKKLELLGEPTLPDSLTAEELFRRMDCGELVLPEEPEVEAEAVPSDKVIPWAKVLRRGAPIAACLALVVFIAQGQLWRMGSSGGANAAPLQKSAADQAAPAEGPETYSFDANGAEPGPGPRAIAIDDDAQEEEADEDVFDDVAEGTAADAARAENGDQKSAVTADGAEDEVLRPDTGGYDLRPDAGGDDLRPDSGWDEPDISNPDSGPVVNPDIGYPGEESSRREYFDYEPQVEEICAQLYLHDERLTGLTPINYGYGVNSDESLLETVCHFENDLGEDVTYRFVLCSITPEGNETYRLTLLDFIEWDSLPIPFSLYDLWDGKSLPGSLLR